MAELFKHRTQAEMAANKLKHFAQAQRLMILSFLLGGERNVSEIDGATAIGQPALSQQLAALRKAELVSTRREGTQIYYSLADEGVEICIRCIQMMTGDNPSIDALITKNPARLIGNDSSQAENSGVAGFARMIP
ncbi:MAG: helix-turn-helix transcriptional regulator [Sphingomonadales bacterium]|nr:helix-turn-helix transcriptional regulator [Sphingomonadales bacterium]